ncbi:MAG: hypothetical protein KKG59_07855 [Nanoarchaeota archaeon]|nr:hypothetical protein [Nanoarchaeota archaeon]
MGDTLNIGTLAIIGTMLTTTPEPALPDAMAVMDRGNIEYGPKVVDMYVPPVHLEDLTLTLPKENPRPVPRPSPNPKEEPPTYDPFPILRPKDYEDDDPFAYRCQDKPSRG